MLSRTFRRGSHLNFRLSSSLSLPLPLNWGRLLPVIAWSRSKLWDETMSRDDPSFLTSLSFHSNSPSSLFRLVKTSHNFIWLQAFAVSYRLSLVLLGLRSSGLKIINVTEGKKKMEHHLLLTPFADDLNLKTFFASHLHHVIMFVVHFFYLSLSLFPLFSFHTIAFEMKSKVKKVRKWCYIELWCTQRREVGKSTCMLCPVHWRCLV